MSIFKKYWLQILFLIILNVFIFIKWKISWNSINCFITETKDLWASIGSVATAISLIFIYLQLRVNKQQVLNAN